MDAATAWDFCPCEEYADIGFTAVSGTWSIKYNSSASKKLSGKKDGASRTIVDVVSMPASVKLRVTKKLLETLGNN